MFGVQSIKCSYTTKSKSVSIAQNQQVGFFQYWAGSGWVLKKSWVASGFGSGRSFFVLARSQVIYYVLNIGVFHPYQHVKHYNIDYAARRNIECF